MKMNTKIIRRSSRIIICKHLHHSKPQIERRSSGGTESQSRAAGGAMERGSERLIFGRMFLKQAPMCRNSFQFADNPRILEITSRHPDFDNTEILLR